MIFNFVTCVELFVGLHSFHCFLYLKLHGEIIFLTIAEQKIDIDKLTADDLRALGIDPNMSKQDIARALKAKFGDSLTIVKGGQKVNGKAFYLLQY